MMTLLGKPGRVGPMIHSKNRPSSILVSSVKPAVCVSLSHLQTRNVAALDSTAMSAPDESSNNATGALYLLPVNEEERKR